ncbi:MULTISPECIES: MarR family winged helix-turn-helix transcriptional regulator [Actinomadura]|jgi:DNA-binding MarR family transcriptional regulator|uniref:DNA-binding MarR family transcriptional regulator n=1 Tax=Actinomadura citrea TaxID=46158 RepID=A0A7Y9GJQ7_9ACTN|nr:MarR family winged helix-turn-helix transcriptional regulator [Actinomadura citrea]NYE16625.1 DNA-binding MarR family transcriptional regulator [Actinomadura citrea]GGT56927.1 MarR family transcriptional regulator [Actinomadura citrea]
MSIVAEPDGQGTAVPDALVHEFGALLGAASGLERIAGRELERRCGIRHAVFEVLLRLSGAGGECAVSMGGLAGDLILTSGGMTRIIDRMQEAGLVRREPAPGDRRRQNVALTPAGRAKLDEALRVHAETLRAHFAGPLTEEQRRVLVDALRTLRTTAREELGDLR